jgi:hypothetical protein
MPLGTRAPTHSTRTSQAQSKRMFRGSWGSECPPELLFSAQEGRGTPWLGSTYSEKRGADIAFTRALHPLFPQYRSGFNAPWMQRLRMGSLLYCAVLFLLQMPFVMLAYHRRWKRSTSAAGASPQMTVYHSAVQGKDRKYQHNPNSF